MRIKWVLIFCFVSLQSLVFAKNFLGPNELDPASITHLGVPQAGGLWVGVGTERAYIEAALLGNQGIYVVDYSPEVTRFHEINRALLVLASNAEDYRRLRFDPSLWPEALSKLELAENSPAVKMLFPKGVKKASILQESRSRDWWKENVIVSDEFKHFHTPPVELAAKAVAAEEDAQLRLRHLQQESWGRLQMRVVDSDTDELISKKQFVKSQVAVNKWKYESILFRDPKPTKEAWVDGLRSRAEREYDASVKALTEAGLLDSAQKKLRMSIEESTSFLIEHSLDAMDAPKPVNVADIKVPYKNANYLFDEELFGKVKAIAMTGQIHAEVADLSKPPRGILNNIKSTGLAVGTFDVSNAWDKSYSYYPGPKPIHAWLGDMKEAGLFTPQSSFVFTDRHGSDFYYGGMNALAAADASAETFQHALTPNKYLNILPEVKAPPSASPSGALSTEDADVGPIKDGFFQKCRRFLGF